MRQPKPKAVIHGKHEQLVFNPHDVHAQPEPVRVKVGDEEWPSETPQAPPPESVSKDTEHP
jgi:hypothetical protein